MSFSGVCETIVARLNDPSLSFPESIQAVVNLIPQTIGGDCNCRLNIHNQEYLSENFIEAAWKHVFKIDSRMDGGRSIEIFSDKEPNKWASMLPTLEAGLITPVGEKLEEKTENIIHHKILQDSEDKYRILTENSADMIWVMDPLLTFRYASPSVFELTGYTPAEWIGTNLFAHTSRDEFSKMARQTIGAMLNYKEFKHVVLTTYFRKKNGGAVSVKIICRLLVDTKGLPIGLQGSARDISERIANKENQCKIERRYQQSLMRLYDAGKMLGQTLDLKKTYKNLHDIIRQNMPCDEVVLSSYDRDKKQFLYEDIWHKDEAFNASNYLPIPLKQMGKRFKSRVVNNGEGYILKDRQTVQKYANILFFMTLEGTSEVKKHSPMKDHIKSAIIVPLHRENQIIGIVQVASFDIDAYTEEHLQFLETLAPQISAAISNAALHQDSQKAYKTLRQSLEGTIYTLAKTIEIRDPYTAGHQERVADLAVAIGNKMQLFKDRILGLRMAALVHDLGKINIPFEILSKPGKLSRMEFELIKTHPQQAYDLLEGITFPWPIADIILQHHEKIDGSGYPMGLRGDEILLESRILTVADIVEAMSSHRPYRPALGIEVAMNEIRSQKGKTLDPDVVDACLDVIRDGFTLE